MQACLWKGMSTLPITSFGHVSMHIQQAWHLCESS